MSETSRDILLNESEKTILDNDRDLSDIGFSGRISKKELETYSKSNLDKLKQALSTNNELQSLIAEVQATPTQEQPKEQPQEEVVDEKPEETKKTKEQPKGEDPVQIEKKYRSEGMSDLYILMRMLERGYVPAVNNYKFKDPTGKVLAIKGNWVWNKAAYILEGGPLTSGKVNTKMSMFNNWADTKIREIAISDIHFEKSQARELLSQLSGKSIKADITSINARIKNLEELELALRKPLPGGTMDVAKIQTLKDEYLRISGKSFDAMAKERGIKLLSSRAGEEKLKNEKQSKIKNKQFADETQRLKDFNLNGTDMKGLGSRSAKLDKGDFVSIKGKTNPGDYIEFSVTKKNPNGTFEIEFKEFQTSGSVTKTGREIVKINRSGQIIDAAGNIRYEGGSYDVKSRKYGVLKKETEALNTKKAKMLELETELAKPHPDKRKIDRLRDDYEKMFNGKKKTLDIGNKAAIKAEKADFEKVKLEIDAIEKKIEALNKKATAELTKLDKLAGKDPTKIDECRKAGKDIITDINKELVELNKKGVGTVAMLDYDDMMKLSKESKWLKSIASANNGLKVIENHKLGKIAIGLSIFTLAASGGKGFYDNIRENGVTKEQGKDMADLAVGFIPVVGGVNDLYVAYKGKDWNNRDLTTKDRAIRTGFGLVGLIPGGGLLIKGGAKLLGKGAAGVKMIKGADVALEGAKVAGKGFTYGFLGYSLVSSTYSFTMDVYDKLPYVGKYKQSVPVKE